MPVASHLPGSGAPDRSMQREEGEDRFARNVPGAPWLLCPGLVQAGEEFGVAKQVANWRALWYGPKWGREERLVVRW